MVNFPPENMDFDMALAIICRICCYDEEGSSKSAVQLAKEVMKKWNLGRTEVEVEKIYSTLQKMPADFTVLQQILEQTCKWVLEKQSQEVIAILRHDLDEILRGRNLSDPHKTSLASTIQQIFGKLTIDIQEELSPIHQDRMFQPTSILVAVGYLFFAALEVDGSITREEITSVKNNLQIWDDESARVILAVVDICNAPKYSTGTISLFSADSVFSDNTKNSIINCIDFLSGKTPPNIRKIIYDQILSIIKADGIIHGNERWIWKELRERWADITT